MDEQWQSIPEFFGYEVSDGGRVRSFLTKGPGSRIGESARILKSSRRGRYSQVTLCGVDGVRASRQVHILVLEAFIGPRPEGCVGRHVNENDKSNNHLSNLLWGTPSQNAADKERHGTVARGQRHGSLIHPERRPRGASHGSHTKPEAFRRGVTHPRAKLAESDVLKIRKLKQEGRTVSSIAREFNIGRTQIMRITGGKSWAHVVASNEDALADIQACAEREKAAQ